MADAQEEIIIIEDSDAVLHSHEQTDEVLDENDEESKQKKIILFGGIAVIVVLLITVTALLLIKKSSTKKVDNFSLLENKLKEAKAPVIEQSKLENMIAKANYLYATGAKEKALTLYENIAYYSQAISQYNLGVAQMKNKQYALALKTFQNAILNDEKRCVSAINAAVCSLHVKDQSSFKYYIDLAYAYLPYEINSPLYSYYYTLISYYNKNYLGALNALKNTDHPAYPVIQNHLSAKINALYNNNYDAIDALEKINEEVDDFSLALLYARIGDFNLAIDHLNTAITKNNQPLRAKLARSYINLKAGHTKKAASQLKKVTDEYPQKIYKIYPVSVKLKDALFDPQKAQTLYRKKIQNSKFLNFQKIFYFSPYKIFNANQTISYIRKGNANIYIDNIQSAQQYLKKSYSASNVDIGITKAIKKALSLKIREANQDLQQLVKIQPKHSILHYNLALTYAQMGDMLQANKHFLRSYHLDAKNYLSGVYAVMTSKLINKDYTKLESILKDSLSGENSSEEIDLYNTLLHINDNDYLSAIEWLDKDYKQRPLYLMLKVLIGMKTKNLDRAKSAASKLTVMFPHDILPHMIYIDTHFTGYTIPKYAEEVLKYLNTQQFTYTDLYYGPFITRYTYIQEHLITGRLYYLQEQLKYVLQTKDTDIQDIESALALTLLYNKNFEEAYTHYNHLIDELKVQDAYTLYLGAVASTAAKHHANAIALLELSKMKNENFYEARYALALLYMEIKNNEGAAIQLQKIDDDSFESEYFEFNIDTDKLLFMKEHPNG
ncbi:tetratricopeptide repeat protein [Sulfurimonas sp. NW9]|uniref:tetratricopeptide repeat protein n=1 Tax=Sulfurimonas sp. NW9 TaxID=2922728 RepID=UPI003DA7D8A7